MRRISSRETGVEWKWVDAALRKQACRLGRRRHLFGPPARAGKTVERNANPVRRARIAARMLKLDRACFDDADGIGCRRRHGKTRGQQNRRRGEHGAHPKRYRCETA